MTLFNPVGRICSDYKFITERSNVISIIIQFDHGNWMANVQSTLLMKIFHLYLLRKSRWQYYLFSDTHAR